MFAIDAEKMALDLRETAVNEGTEDSRIAYRLHQNVGTLNLLKSFFNFQPYVSIEFCSELKSLSNSI
jgi:hypothetical protein